MAWRRLAVRADALPCTQLLHGRWAMLGALGAILPEAIDSFGGDVPGAVWWQARKSPIKLTK